jgi:hypothetical protein
LTAGGAYAKNATASRTTRRKVWSFGNVKL